MGEKHVSMKEIDSSGVLLHKLPRRGWRASPLLPSSRLIPRYLLARPCSRAQHSLYIAVAYQFRFWRDVGFCALVGSGSLAERKASWSPVIAYRKRAVQGR